MTCMILNHFQSFNAVSKELKPSKIGWTHEVWPKEGHASEVWWTTTSKLQYMYMHATLKLQFTINDPNHDLALQSNMDHATINSKHEQEDNGATFSRVVQEGSSNMQSTLQIFKFSKPIHNEIKLSPLSLSLSLSLVRLCSQNELRKCFEWSVIWFKDGPYSGPLSGKIVNKSNSCNWPLFNLIKSY